MVLVTLPDLLPSAGPESPTGYNVSASVLLKKLPQRSSYLKRVFEKDYIKK